MIIAWWQRYPRKFKVKLPLSGFVWIAVEMSAFSQETVLCAKPQLLLLEKLIIIIMTRSGLRLNIMERDSLVAEQQLCTNITRSNWRRTHLWLGLSLHCNPSIAGGGDQRGQLKKLRFVAVVLWFISIKGALSCWTFKLIIPFIKCNNLTCYGHYWPSPESKTNSVKETFTCIVKTSHVVFWDITLCNLLRVTLTFRGNIMPPSSGLNNPNKVPVWKQVPCCICCFRRCW
jgi:hypothetical protein